MTQLEALRAALKPFADLLDSWLRGHHKTPETVSDDETLPGRWVKVGDLRRAAEAYAALEASTDGEGWVRVPREAIQQMAKRLDSGCRRLETAGNACEEVEAQLRALIDKPPMKLHFTNDWLKKKIEEDPDDMPETVP